MSSRTIKQLREQEKANHIAILKQGWLTKKGALMGAPRFVVAHAAAGAKVKNWKRRWCVLVDGQGSDSAAELLYCKTRKNFFFSVLTESLCADASQDETKAPAGAFELEHGGSAALTTVAGKQVRPMD